MKTWIVWLLAVCFITSCKENEPQTNRPFPPTPTIAANNSGSTLETVRKRGELICGVSPGINGFSNADIQGNWRGFDVDYCRALAVATLGSPNKVRFVPLSATDRFTALSLGEVDVLARNSTWTLSRETDFNLLFVGVSYYDGQGFLIRSSTGATSPNELNGTAICVKKGTSSEQNLADYFHREQMQYHPVEFASLDESKIGFEAGRCDVLSSDVSQLYALRATLKNPNGVEVLPDQISKEPLGPVVRQDDILWFNIAKWTLNALIIAEDLNLSKNNIAKSQTSTSPDVQRFIGLKDNLGNKLGLDNRWAYNIVKYIGNYGEVFDRNLGTDSDLNIDRHINISQEQGGILYAPPIR